MDGGILHREDDYWKAVKYKAVFPMVSNSLEKRRQLEKMKTTLETHGQILYYKIYLQTKVICFKCGGLWFVCLFWFEGWCLPPSRWLLTLPLPPYHQTPRSELNLGIIYSMPNFHNINISPKFESSKFSWNNLEMECIDHLRI